MKRIVIALLLAPFLTFSQSNDYFSYIENNKDKWTYYISKNQIGNVFDGIKEEISKYAKICTANQYCLEVRQTNDDEIYISLNEGRIIPGPSGIGPSGVAYNSRSYKDESDIFLLEYKKRVESLFSGVKGDYIDPTLILEIAFNNDPKTIERFADDRPNFIEDGSSFYLNEYFSNDNDYQVILRGRISSVPFDELNQFLKAYPNAQVLKPFSEFFNLLKINSSIQIKLSGMGMEDVLSFSLKGSSKALSIFSLN